MPYTLAKFFVWFVVAALAGGTIGWLLRSLTARRAAARPKSVDGVDAAEVGNLREQAARLGTVTAERDRLRMELADLRGRGADDVDLAEAEQVLGHPVRLDDLTVVEGIGPRVAELCTALGIDSWETLARTDVARLQSMLDDAGSRFQMHQPATWPTQARLLADGRWVEFRELVAGLSGGTSTSG